MKSFSTLLLLMGAVSGCGGSPGAAGANGTNGTSNAISHGIHCSKLDSGTGTQLDYTYDSETLTNGDRYVSCSVANAGQESSYSDYYAASKTGATTGYCSVDLGVGATDFGSWGFTSQSGVTGVVYSDAGSAHNGYSYTFSSGDCATF